ncbi:unnamed protein product [Cylindrotheca closterium]|uniref:Uncharacterized protein n=1 Tax=Cylindrotheca closterium TaxID=2856 RepID=A0AAD2G237_9STRA|nr:unnamed protein product [Cylindrotheca closterium]
MIQPMLQPMVFYGFVFLSFCFFHPAEPLQSQIGRWRVSCRIERGVTERQLSLDNTLLPTPGPADDEEQTTLNRWEQMYFEAGQAEKGDLIDQNKMIRSAVRVVTFDLDNTLWKTKQCIGAANDALASYLDKHNVQQPKRIEEIMRELFQANKKVYAPRTENATAPVLLTQLRKDALKEVLMTSNEYTEEEAETFANKAFERWTAARHEAIPLHFASDVLGCLQRISSIRSNDGTPLLIGAITDGNSDPRNVDELKDYFDFCVNAESVGVSKPDRRVFLDAVRYVVSHPDFQDLGRTASDNEDDLEDVVGPYWVHIGDDFSKDIVAAKSMRMRSIWAQELIRDKLPKTSIEQDEGRSLNLEDFVRKVSEKEVIEMSIGADNYLADAMTQEFADSVATTFSGVSEILSSWHREALADEKKMDAALEVIMPDTSISPSVENPIPFGDSDFIVSATVSRTFRLTRNDCSMDVPAPFKNREEQTMKDIMAMAQLNKASGVFSFPPDEVELLTQGKRTLMVEIATTGIKFSREIFADAFDSPSFDLF